MIRLRLFSRIKFVLIREIRVKELYCRFFVISQFNVVNWNRILSGSVVLVYFTLALVFVNFEIAMWILIGAVFPLAFIWFSDALGSYVGRWGDMWIDTPSPSGLICFLGWILLLMPVIRIAIFIEESH